MLSQPFVWDWASAACLGGRGTSSALDRDFPCELKVCYIWCTTNKLFLSIGRSIYIASVKKIVINVIKKFWEKKPAIKKNINLKGQSFCSLIWCDVKSVLATLHSWWLAEVMALALVQSRCRTALSLKHPCLPASSYLLSSDSWTTNLFSTVLSCQNCYRILRAGSHWHWLLYTQHSPTEMHQVVLIQFFPFLSLNNILEHRVARFV